MHSSPAEGNFCDEYGNAVKLGIVHNYNAHMGYVDKSDHMTKIASLKTVQHYIRDSGKQNISTVTIPLLPECPVLWLENSTKAYISCQSLCLVAYQT